jgi:tetratricopeptide (TPR) repeat protein
MQRPAGARLTPALAREVAVREGIKGVVTGEVSEVSAAGPQYLLAAQLVSAATGEVLAAYRETASGATELIGTVDRLSKRLREKIGEPLKAIRRDPPLTKVTTSSLAALRRYTEAVRADEVEGDYEKAVALLEAAIALDTGFAMAYERLGGTLFNQGQDVRRAVQALTRAFQHRDRLTERERYLTLGNYYINVTYELEKAATAFRALLESHPDDGAALNNLGWVYLVLRQHARAEELFRRLVAIDSSWQGYANLIWAQLALGKRREAERTLGQFAKRLPDNPWVEYVASFLATSSGNYGSAEAHARALKKRHGESLMWRLATTDQLAYLAAVRGRQAEAERHRRDAMQASAESGEAANYIAEAVAVAWPDVWVRHETARALKEVEAALARYPLDSMPPIDRPYLLLAQLYALAGKPGRARALLAEYERAVDPVLRRQLEQDHHGASGELALAEGRLTDAVAEFRQQAASHGGLCYGCGLAGLGRAYDRMSEPDSAIAIYERYLTTTLNFYRLRIPQEDAVQLAPLYRRLGELHEQRGEREKAAHYYTRFVDLWKDCDPELRPQVDEVRRRVSQLSGASRG